MSEPGSFPEDNVLTIQRYDETGHGVGDYTRSDGYQTLVRVFGTIAEEKISFGQLVKSKKVAKCRDGVDIGQISVSPHRVSPRCPHFGTCGGCVWQHMRYDEQLRVKEKKVHELFEPLLKEQGVEEEEKDHIFHPILGMSDSCEWHYRNKMEFSFSQDRKGNRFLGLYDRLGRGVVSLEVCHLVNSWMTEALHLVRSWWEKSQLMAYSPRTGQGTLRTLTLREGMTSGDRMIILTVSSNPEYAPSKHLLDEFVEMCSVRLAPTIQQERDSPHLSIVLRIHQAIRGVPTQIYEMILKGKDYIRETLDVEVSSSKRAKKTFHISPLAFFQPNTRIAQNIYSRALVMADLRPNDVVYDLYCGTGTFGMFAAEIAREVVAIEISKDAAYDAKTNAQRLHIDNFSIHCGDVGEVVSKLRKDPEHECPKPSVVIVDPPRSGLGPKAIDQIVDLMPDRIVYVSCNPINQARDIAQLMQKAGYTMTHIQPVDQFPHTPHMENIAILRRM